MPTRAKAPPLAEQEFQQLLQHVQCASGIRLGADRRALVEARLAPRLRKHNLDDFSEYLDLLDAPDSTRERAIAVDLLLCKETYFFREHRHFEFLGQWLARTPTARRFWSAACASGEEAWSIAMVASEHACNDGWTVLASDLSELSLQRFEEGVYDLAQARYFPGGWLQRHGTCGSGELTGRWRVGDSLRRHVQGRTINLAWALPADLPGFDVIFLRNLLRYFDEDEQQRIVHRLLEHLNPGGLLVTGHTERIHALGLPLRPILPSVFERL